MKNLLWYLVAGTKGGETRGKIINLLQTKPSNANNIIMAINKGNYGAVYFLSEDMKTNYKVFGEIWVQFGKK